MSTYHVPVLLAEVLEALNVAPARRMVDATLGGGGHAVQIAQRIAPGGVLIGLDQDGDALQAAGQALKAVPETVETHLVQTNFAGIRDALEGLDIAAVDGVLMDLGVSSYQLDTPNRGFSFRGQGPLDMRMNSGGDEETAAELLNRLPEAEIARILFTYGEESRSRRIASEIVRRRQIKPLATTEDLADAVRGAMPYRTRPGEIHPATKTFQAVRIAVNRELEVLETALREAAAALDSGGRLVVIAYHSLEDRIVKNVFAELSGKRIGSDMPDLEPVAAPILTLVTRKPLVPTDDEVRRNPRSRSAKLRVAEKK
ncbi:MAG: 16S rRNA (cytosine(1402)-N(4))-methyltransferase RsmH [Armatimonadota bacterium]